MGNINKVKNEPLARMAAMVAIFTAASTCPDAGNCVDVGLADRLKLEALRLTDCQLSVDALAEIARMGSLRELHLESNVTVDLAGLTELHRLGQLNKLRIWGVAMGDDDRAIAELKALAHALPHCHIQTDLPMGEVATARIAH